MAAERFIGFDELVARASVADVVFSGEQHGLAPGHRLQLALLQGLAARGADAALSLEMFERDVAPLFESYAADGAAGTRGPVVHLTGAFHSDHGDGIPRVCCAGRRVQTITLTVVPVDDLRASDPAPHRARADYLLFVVTG